MKKGCNQCGKPLKDCGHRTLQELMTSKVNMQEEIENILLRIDLTYKETAKLIEALIKKHEREVLEKVLDYVEHERDCILNGYSAGRPTKDGGYETKIGGKWYQARPVDET